MNKEAARAADCSDWLLLPSPPLLPSSPLHYTPQSSFHFSLLPNSLRKKKKKVRGIKTPRKKRGGKTGRWSRYVCLMKLIFLITLLFRASEKKKEAPGFGLKSSKSSRDAAAGGSCRLFLSLSPSLPPNTVRISPFPPAARRRRQIIRCE